MEKAQNRLSIVPYAGITQIRCGRSLTLPLRLYTDSHILYGHMIAQNKKNVKETAYRKTWKEFENKCFKLYITFLFSLVPGCSLILIRNKGNTELNSFFHGLFDQFFHLC